MLSPIATYLACIVQVGTKSLLQKTSVISKEFSRSGKILEVVHEEKALSSSQDPVCGADWEIRPVTC